jgi:hypothetical protein
MDPEIMRIQLGMLSMYLLNAAEADPSNPDNDIAPELHERMYAKRTREMWMAAGFAASAGLGVGVAIDPKEPDWPVLFIELGDGIGQVSWHIPAHPVPFDGHTTAEKYRRIAAFAELHDLAPARPVMVLEARGEWTHGVVRSGVPWHGHTADTSSVTVDSRKSSDQPE